MAVGGWKKTGRLMALGGLALVLAGPAVSAKQPPKAASAPPVESTPARKLETAIMTALVPVGEPGWQVPTRPRITPTGTGFSLKAEAISYLLGHGLALDFEAVEAQLTPQPGGTFNVVAELGGYVTLRAPEGVWATAYPGRNHLTGVWDPARESFRSLDVTMGAFNVSLANGAMISLDQAVGRFTTPDERVDGTVTLTGVQTGLVGSYQGRTADEVFLKFRLDSPGAQPVIALDYRHSLPGTGLTGIAGELMPLRLGLAARIDSFPWQNVLAELPPWLVEVASRTPPNPGQMWSALWTHVAKALGEGNAQMAVERVDARSAALVANGSGAVSFAAAGPRGNLQADLRGINERIAQLSSADRRNNPMLFPALALMTVVGDGVNEGGRRFHRYRIELAENGLKVNGRDAGGLKP
ncbi:MAG: hypothetical protein K2X44_06015 [Magnetospirillum sp.]|nr:hypothetical protein [Magnetospirillum sp.]